MVDHLSSISICSSFLVVVGSTDAQMDKFFIENKISSIKLFNFVFLHALVGNHHIVLGVALHITFILNNTTYELLFNLEPWCSKVVVDYSGIKDAYITHEQPNTSYDLSEKVKFNWDKPHYDYQLILYPLKLTLFIFYTHWV